MNAAGARTGAPTASLSSLLFGFLLLAGTAAGWASIAPGHGTSAIVEVLLWLNTTILVVAISVEAGRRPYSLHLMHLVSLFLFVGAAAVFQYRSGTLAVAGPVTVVAPQILTSALAVTCWIVVYLAVYESHRALAAPVARSRIGRYLDRPLELSRVRSLSVLSVAAIVYLGFVGLLGVSSRGVAEETVRVFSVEAAGAAGFGVAFYLLNHYLLRAFPLVTMAALLHTLKGGGVRGTTRSGLIALLFAIVIGNALANNPLATSRMWTVTTLFCVALPFFFLRLKTGWPLVVTSLAGLAVLPALNENRMAESFNDVIDFFFIASPFEYLARSSDVDSLGMLALCIKWTEGHGHMFGLQTLGGLLFWFPRRFWPGKPVGTGGMVTKDFGWDFTNLAPPVMAEGWVDLGFLGVALLAVVFAFLFSRIDLTYWAESDPTQRSRRLLDVIYPFWVASVVFMTRGDLIGASAHTAAFSMWIIPMVFGVRWIANHRSVQRAGAARTP